MTAELNHRVHVMNRMLSNYPSSLPVDTRRPADSYVRAAGSFLPKLTSKAFEKYGFHSAEIMTTWSTIVGPELAAITRPERVKWPRQAPPQAGEASDARHSARGAIVLRVEPARALDVQYRSREICDRINRHFGYLAIDRVTVVQASFVEPEPTPTRVTPAAPASQPPPELDDIPDDGLRQALNGLWSSIASERRAR